MICVKLLGNDGYAGMRITCRGMRDMWWRDGDMRDMRDGPPPRNRAVGSAVFLDRPPQSTKGGKKERQTTANQKGMLIFNLNC